MLINGRVIIGSPILEDYMDNKDQLLIKTLDDCYDELKKESVTLSSMYHFFYKNKTIYTTLGRIWFNLLLPESYPEFVNNPVDKKELEKIVYTIYSTNSAADAAKIISNIQAEAFKLATINPITFSENSFIVPQNIEKLKKSTFTETTKIEDYNDLKFSLAKELLDQSNDEGLINLINSKATSKLGIPDLAMWLIAKGPIMDIEDKISKPIRSALVDGYNGEEYYTAAAEARRGYFIRAVGTSDPGTLARHVVFALSNIKLDGQDCKTTKYLEIFIKEPMLKLLSGRFYLNERTGKLVEITADSKNIINTMIKLRSPLFCKAKNGICKTCYGSNSNNLGTANIGLIAGAIVNMVGVQGYAMKARHAATTVTLKKCDFTKDIIYI